MRIPITLTKEIAAGHGFHEYDCLQEQLRTLTARGSRIPVFLKGERLPSGYAEDYDPFTNTIEASMTVVFTHPKALIPACASDGKFLIKVINFSESI